MISLCTPNFSGNEWQYIKDCLDTNWVSSVGNYITKFEEITAKYTGAKYAIATSNGTAAIHISLMLAGVKTNDLVIAPNITFVASINAIKYTGASPILIDVDQKTWQMDIDLLKSFLESQTIIKNQICIHKNTNKIIKAILPVHVLGNMCDMDKLMALTNKYHITVVEDSTEALGSYYKNKHAGTFGLFGTLSYNGNKLITTGGGGMILTDDDNLAKKAKHITTTAKTDPKAYFHDEIGYNYRLINILAAMGVAQMEQLDSFLARKKEIATFYNRRLSTVTGFETQKILADVSPNYWLYTVKLPKIKVLLAHLSNLEIEARPFWVPMNQLPANKQDMFVTEKDTSNQIYNNCISLPSSSNITDEQLESVIDAILKFYKQ